MHRITDDKVNQFLVDHLPPQEGLIKELEDYAARLCIPIVQPEVARLLSLLITLKKPHNILEVGCAIGYSGLVMLEAAPTAHLTTIERDPGMQHLATENFQKGGVTERVTILSGDACEIIPALPDQELYDVLFLDAAKSRYNDFLPHCIRLLSPQGLLICDNVLFRGMVARDYDEVPHAIRTIYYRLNEFHDTLTACPQLTTSVIPIGDGVSVSIRK